MLSRAPRPRRRTGPTGSPTLICCSARADVRPGALARAVVVQERRGAERVSAAAPAVRPEERRRAGQREPLPLYRVDAPDGTTRELAEVRRIGIQATLVDPAPEQEYKVNIRDRKPVREFRLRRKLHRNFGKFSFGTYLWNSVFITVIATLITLLFNAMAASRCPNTASAAATRCSC
jgi:hypothetical protein